jgi:hypothetical protein
VYVDILAPDGATWLNAIHFPQCIGSGGAKKYYAVLDSAAPGTSTIDVTSDASAGVVRPALFGKKVRARHTFVDADADGSFTFAVTMLVER